MQGHLQTAVMNDAELLRLSKLGFQAFVRAYATHPSRLRSIFHPNELHLGHVARSFGQNQKPSEIDSKEFKKTKAEVSWGMRTAPGRV